MVYRATTILHCTAITIHVLYSMYLYSVMHLRLLMIVHYFYVKNVPYTSTYPHMCSPVQKQLRQAFTGTVQQYTSIVPSTISVHETRIFSRNDMTIFDESAQLKICYCNVEELYGCCQVVDIMLRSKRFTKKILSSVLHHVYW